MKYFNFLKPVAAVVAFAAAVSSCKKADEVVTVGDAGQTIIKLKGTAGLLTDPGFTDVQFSSLELKLLSTPVVYDVVDVRRNAANSTKFNTTVVVKVKNDPGLVSSYNSNYLTNFVALPDSQIVVGASTPLSGNTYTVTIGPGEFAKNIQFTVKNGAALDLGKAYAMGFSIVSSTGDGNISLGEKKVVVEFGVKNKYDGVYNLEWTNYHPTSNPGYTGGTQEVEMRTTGATKNKIFWPAAAAFANPAIIGGNLQYFGVQEPEYTVNEATNAVTVQNTAAGAVTFYTMATGYNSRYDPATKTYYVKWGYTYGAGGAFDPANTREWTQKITYVKPR